MIDIPHCAACTLGKQAREPSGATPSMTRRSGGLSHDVLIPGQVIYSDQFFARVKGKGFPAHPGIGQKQEYSGGTVFYDPASKYLCVELQVGYTAVETIKSKLRLEWMQPILVSEFMLTTRIMVSITHMSFWRSSKPRAKVSR